MSEEPTKGLGYRDMVDELVMSYAEYFRHLPWPKSGSDAWDDLVRTWADAFGEYRYSRHKIDRAMRTIKRKPPSFLPDHLPELLRLLHEHDENYAQPDTIPEQVIDEGPCELCYGGGLATIFHDSYTGLPWIREGSKGHYRVRALRITAPCVCPKGRSIFQQWQSKDRSCVDLMRLPPQWSTDNPDSRDFLPRELNSDGQITLGRVMAWLREQGATADLNNPGSILKSVRQEINRQFARSKA